MSLPQNIAPAQKYPGQSLPTPDHIRLISLYPASDDAVTCELIMADLHSAPKYEALSYTWGDASDCQTIYMKTTSTEDPIEFQVTSNCVSALRCLRLKNRPRVLWIDALGIDQHNIPERNHQVTLMSQIYSGATNVAVYLGEPGNDSDMAIKFIEELDNPSIFTTSLSFPKSPALLQALNSFFHRPWFSRVWVIQEVLLSNSAIAYCGHKSVSWSAVKGFQQWNVDKKWLYNLPFVLSKSVTNFPGSRGFTPYDPMLTLLLQARSCQSTDPRDKIYGLLPLHYAAGHQFDLKPQYEESVIKVYTDCAAAIMESEGWYAVLCAVQGHSKLANLPSWVPDWSNEPKRSIIGMLRNFVTGFENPKQVNVSACPKLLHRDSSMPILRVVGYPCGKITKIGTTYFADKGPFPLHEWENEWDTDDLPFFEVISTWGYSNAGALRRYVDMEERSIEDAEEPKKPKQSNIFKRFSAKNYESGSIWQQSIRQANLNGIDGDASKSPALPFNDIPFHRAAIDQPSSNRMHVQRVLKNCHARRLFLTDTGMLGLAPEEAQLGDDIFAFVGAGIPFLLREVDNSTYEHGLKLFQLVGECYVDEDLLLQLISTDDDPQELDIM